jgi:glycosyltransferase involved in cell wall biosynthesis
VTHRLLYVVGQLHSGGLERQLFYLLQAMDRERYTPAVAVWHYSESDLYVPKIKALGVPIHAIPPGFSGHAKLEAFRCLAGRLEPEVIHSYSFYTNFAAHWGSRGTAAIAIGSVRSDFLWDKRETGRLLGRLSARFPKHQVCNSRSAADSVRKSRSLFAPRHVSVVRNGVDMNCFRNIPAPANGAPRILGVGSLRQVKRWDRLVSAFAELRQKGFSCTLEIAGAGTLQKKLEQQAQDLGVSTGVRFLGQRNEIPDLLARTTLLAHTAENEGCPNAVMEAMACGRPVVATDAGDTAGLVDDGKTGFVVPQNNPGLLVDRMARLLADQALCRSMGAAGRAKAEREFGLDRLVCETLTAYRCAGWKSD